MLTKYQTAFCKIKHNGEFYRTPLKHSPLSRSKGQRSRSPGCFTHRRVGTSDSCSGGRGNVLAARGASASTGEERGGALGISWRPPAYSLFCVIYIVPPKV